VAGRDVAGRDVAGRAVRAGGCRVRRRPDARAVDERWRAGRSDGQHAPVPRPLPPDVRILAENQDGVLARAQLRRAGIGRDVVRRAVSAGRWTAIGPRVVVLSSGAVGRRQRAWAAVLHAGPRAGLAGRTAAEFAGLRGWTEEDVHVVVPKGGPAVRPQSGTVVHESRRLHPGDVLVSASPPRVRPARALVDAAAWSRSPRAAVGLLVAGVQQRLATPAQLRAELATAGHVRHARLLRLTLADIAGGSQALSELDLVAGCRARGLPVPERQAVRWQDGRRRYLDAVFRRADGSVLVVEVDGAGHLMVGTWWDDLDRQNELLIGGEPVLRFPAARLRTDPDRCFGQIRRALAVRSAA
jgi:hypothetical protein